MRELEEMHTKDNKTRMVPRSGKIRKKLKLEIIGWVGIPKKGNLQKNGNMQEKRNS